METAVIVRGRPSDARHIELDEAVSGIEGEVEVVENVDVVSTGDHALEKCREIPIERIT